MDTKRVTIPSIVAFVTIALLYVYVFAQVQQTTKPIANQSISNTTPDQPSTDCKTMPAKDISLTESTILLFHVHPFLNITILGNQLPVPPDVGRSDTVLRAIHTHDSTGILHVESPCIRQYTLGDFFDIWGQTFNSTCILSYCNDANHTLKMTVDGVENYSFDNLILIDEQDIQIIYE